MCICLLLYREHGILAGVVFYYNNKITRAFNTPSTLHTHFLFSFPSRHHKLPFHIFVASSRNFPRYLFHLNARAKLSAKIFLYHEGTLKVSKVFYGFKLCYTRCFFLLRQDFQALLIYNLMATPKQLSATSVLCSA